MTGRPTSLAILAVVVALLAPLASADRGDLTVDLARYRGGATQSGELTILYIVDDLDAGTLTDPAPAHEPSTPFLDLQALRMHALEVETRSLTGPGLGPVEQPVPDPTYDANAPPRVTDLQDVQAALATYQPGFQLHVLAMQAPSSYQAGNGAGSFFPMDSAYVRAGAFQQAPSTTQDYLGQDPESSTFWGVHFPAPHVGHQEESGRLDMVLRGDLVVEMNGLSLAVTGPGNRVLSSGTEQVPVAGPVPLYHERNVLLRLFLEDAMLRVSLQGGSPSIQWASPTVEANPGGATTLQGATGSLASDEGAVILHDDAYLLPAGNTLRFAPSEQALALGVQPAPAAATASPSLLGGELSAALVGAGAILSLLVAVGLGLLRRWLAPPTLHAVELALSEGRHGHAARLAGRILRRQPRDQDAALARAVALSKGGRPKAAIRLARRHLGTADPADGSLHYVLGLALLDVGSDAEAHAALDEAVRRTPALHEDVLARRTPSKAPAPRPAPQAPFAVPAPHKEVHGYA